MGTAHAISCVLPFDSLKQHHPIDDSCVPTGKSDPRTPQALQNQAKNDFCSDGVPVHETFDDLKTLQSDAAGRVTFGGDRKIPPDRSLLRKVPF